MSFWSKWFKSVGTNFGTVMLTGLVVEVKTSIDQNKKMTPDEKVAAKLGVDLLADVVTTKLGGM